MTDGKRGEIDTIERNDAKVLLDHHAHVGLNADLVGIKHPVPSTSRRLPVVEPLFDDAVFHARLVWAPLHDDEMFDGDLGQPRVGARRGFGGDAVADRGLAGDLLGVEDAVGVAVHADLDEHTALSTSVHGAAEGRRAGERAQALRTLIAVLTGFASVTSVALGAGITRRALVALITLLTVVALGSGSTVVTVLTGRPCIATQVDEGPAEGGAHLERGVRLDVVQAPQGVAVAGWKFAAVGHAVDHPLVREGVHRIGGVCRFIVTAATKASA